MNIDDLFQSKQSGECRLLNRLYEFLRVPYNEGGNWIALRISIPKRDLIRPVHRLWMFLKGIKSII